MYYKNRFKNLISLIAILSALMFAITGCKSNVDTISGDARPIPPRQEYVNFEYLGEFSLNGDTPISVSPNGKYALAQERYSVSEDPNDIGVIFKIYINENDEYVPFREISAYTRFPRIEDECIIWSHDSESFAFSIPRALQNGWNSDIYVVDIKSGECKNLTGIAGEEEISSRRGTWFIDFALSWSDDDSRIYFARYGRRDDKRGFELCSVSRRGGAVETIKTFEDGERLMYGLFSYGDALFYTTFTNEYDIAHGICMYKNGAEKLLVSHDIYAFVDIKEVSADGKLLLYKVIEQGGEYDGYFTYFYAPIDSPEDAVELKTTSGGYVMNAMFSPDGNTILKIEGPPGDSDANYMYLIDTSAPEKEPRLAYKTDEITYFFGVEPQPINWALLQPIWMSNGFVAINAGGDPIIFKVNTK